MLLGLKFGSDFDTPSCRLPKNQNRLGHLQIRPLNWKLDLGSDHMATNELKPMPYLAFSPHSKQEMVSQKNWPKLSEPLGP